MDEFINREFWEDQDGILVNKKNRTENTAFSSAQQNNLYQIEDHSWWFQYRSKVILMMLESFFDRSRQIVDVGGGNGYTTIKAEEAGYTVALMEPSREACVNAKKRGLTRIFCGTLDEEGIVDDTIEGVICLDVLEHIEDDRAFIKLINKKLIKGGVCLITVPAFMALWSSEDVEAGHFRRYKCEDLEKIAEAGGFDVIYINYFMSFLYLPILLFRVGLEKLGIIKKRDKRTAAEQERLTKLQFEERTGVVGYVLSVFETIEIKRLKNKHVNKGSSIIMVLKKR